MPLIKIKKEELEKEVELEKSELTCYKDNENVEYKISDKTVTIPPTAEVIFVLWLFL